MASERAIAQPTELILDQLGRQLVVKFNNGEQFSLHANICASILLLQKYGAMGQGLGGYLRENERLILRPLNLLGIMPLN